MTDSQPASKPGHRSSRRLRWLIYCLVMLVGYCGVSAWEELRLRQQNQWISSARNAGMQAQRRDAWRGPHFAPKWLQTMFAKPVIDVTVRAPEQIAVLKTMVDDGLPLMHIIFSYHAGADEIRRLHSEFPGVRLLEKPPGKTWLTDVVR